MSAVIIPLCLAAAVFLSIQAYLENHAFLFLERTWMELEESFGEFKDRTYIDTNGMKAINEAVSDALAYHDKLEYQISLTKSPLKKQEYQARLESSTCQAGSSLASYYADYMGSFLYQCGKTELRTQLHDSMLYQFLILAQGPDYTGPAPSYTQKDLEFLGQVAVQLGKAGPGNILQPEEAFGLAMAATELKLRTAVEYYGISPAMGQTLSGLLFGYWDSCLADIDQRLSDAHNPDSSPPLDRGAVWDVHAYMLEQYRVSGDFELSVPDSCSFAKDHLENRRQGQLLMSAIRLTEEHNPFPDFTPEDIKPRSVEEIVSFAPVPRNAARDLLKNWSQFTMLLNACPPARFDLCLVLTF